MMASKRKPRISVVEIGATRSMGGTRKRTVRVGGADAMPFHSLGNKSWKPVVSHDVFDMRIPLPSAVRECFGDAIDSPVDWARMNVEKYGADLMTLHLVSTDPKLANRSVRDACRILEDVLQAVKVPLIVGGSGNPQKDAELLEYAAEVCAGERCLLSSVSLDMDYRRVAKAAVEHGHPVLSLTTMSPDQMRVLNRNLMKEGLDPEHIIMDPFTGGIGYGIEYTVSTMQRIRLSGLDGVREFMMPIASAASNAWSAREAWMKNSEWGERKVRGVLWETSTALTALLSGADLFMMLHPESVRLFKKTADSLVKRR